MSNTRVIIPCRVVPCAGFVIFTHDLKKTVLVETHRGNLSFPKGKRHKGETDLETALRELSEETGLTSEDILFDPEIYLDEVSNKGNPNIRYFIGKLIDHDFNFTFREKELADVKWYDTKKVSGLPNLKDIRKKVFSQSVKIAQT